MISDITLNTKDVTLKAKVISKTIREYTNQRGDGVFMKLILMDEEGD
jgi:hypothetical protein